MRVTDFLRDMRGSMTYTGLGFLFVTIAVGGMSVDVMRHEATRAKVQQSLDACTSNVGAMKKVNATDAALTTAVADCMVRAGVTATMATVNATNVNGLLQTTASGTQQNKFMQMAGKTTTNYSGNAAGALNPLVAGSAEVVLAYEASNAMTAAGLTTVLKTAMGSFVDTVNEVDASNPNGLRPKTSVALVPYTDGVNLPAALLARYNVTNVSNVTNSNCIDVPTADFSTMPISTSTSYRTMGMVDLASSTLLQLAYQPSNGTNATVGTTSVPCPPYVNNVLRTPTNLAATVKTNITNAQFFGGLRWDHGMHWATALLEPSTNAAIAGFLPANMNTRPLAYNTDDLQKVIVFINRSGTGSNPTDGTHVVLAPAFATGLSPIYRKATVTPNLYCISLPARTVTPKFYRPDVNQWVSSCPSDYTQLTWPQVWSSVRATWVAWQLYARGMATTQTPTLASVSATYTTTLASFQQIISFDTQKTQFEAECAAAKANGVVIYTVALDAVARAKGPLQTCATSAAHYFDATSATFPTVMATIATTIKQQANPK